MSSDQSDRVSGRGRRWRRIAVFAGIPVTLVVVALAGTVLFRQELLLAAVQNRLRAAGIEDTRLRVEQVTTRAISLSEFKWGEALSFDRLTVGFSLRDLLQGRISNVALTGLRMDLTQTEAWAALLHGDGDSAGLKIDPRVLPVMEISGARLRLASPVGTMGVAAYAVLRPSSNGELAVQLKASVEGPPGQVDVLLDGTVGSVVPGEATATAVLSVTSSGLTMNGTAIKSLIAELPVRLKAGPKTAEIVFTDDSRLALGGVGFAGAAPPFDVSAGLSGRIALAWPDSGPEPGLTVEHALTIRPAPVTVAGTTALRVALGRIDATGKLSAASAYSGDVTIDSGRLSRGDLVGAVEGLAVRLTTGSDFASPAARITIEALRDVSAVQAPGSYSLAATVRREGDGLAFQAGIGGFGIQKLAAVNGVHDLVGHVGHAALSIPDLSIGSDGLRLDTVLPALGAVRNLAGTIGGTARLDWRGDRLDGRATLRLAGIGGETDNGAVEGIGGAIAFDGLFPPRTAPDQSLRIRRITAGAVLTDASIRFALLPAGILRIDRADAALADGRVVLVAPAIDLAAQKARATVTFENVQLEQILGLAALGDFYATGRVHGSIPLRIDGTSVAVDGGALAARGGGVLRLRSERAKQALQSGGEQVAQMLLALENFSYERLSVDIDKSPAGESIVTLRTLGHNPAVLNGRKFQINVNLETNLDRILNAVLQWYQLSGRALRDIVRP